MSESATPMSDSDSFQDAEDKDRLSSRARSRSSMRSLTESPSSRSADRKASEPSQTPISEEEATPRITSEPSHPSPLVTARKHVKNPSTTSFAEVHLDEQPAVPPTPQPETIPETDRGRPESTVSSTSPNESRRSSASRPGSNRSSVPTTASTMPPPPKPLPTGPVRAFPSPFGWFQRKKTASSASIPTLTPTRASGSGPELKLDGLGEEKTKESLKERFKQLRMKEEAGIEIQKVTSPEALTPGGVHGLGIDTSVANTADDNASVKSPAPSTDRESVVSYAAAKRRDSSASTVDPSLPPGTVAGAASGPENPAAPIDWDLWQTVVNEGPSAVAKSTPAELNKAIAGGIPATIRGVVWQVIAQSEDKGLEQVYWELVNRGTEKELLRSPKMSPSPATTPGGGPNSSSMQSTMTKDTITSSASSVHSETSASMTTNGRASPALEVPIDSKAQAEQAKKAKDDMAALRKLEKTIRKDMGSRSNYSRYATAQNLQDGLFNVCKAYALYDDAVGYAQGMNFIVMPILFNMPEEEAFCLLVRLMRNYKVRDMFIQEMPGLHLHIEQFSKLLDDLEPALAQHLRKRGILPSLYATQWFLTLFAYRFPLQLVLRIYDLVLTQGFETAILKFALALIRKNAAQLLEIKDMGALKTFLNEKLFDAYIDHAPSNNSILESGFFGFAGSTGVDRDVYRADLLVQDACAVEINAKELDAITQEYQRQTKEQKDHAEELDRLRREHLHLTAKVKSLEKNAQKTDADHVELMNQMISSKMENEELKAANVDLTVELEEMKLSLASLPAEIEKGLKDDIEGTKARINEVMAQNNSLEDQMKEMEGMLVAKSMELASLSAEHDALRQKWQDLRRALGD